MVIPLHLTYLVATIPLVLMWLTVFFLRKDLRKEILVVSICMAFLSVGTSYYWWTVDWWQPPTIWGTRVGIEDFILGFAAGGLMTSLYEVVFKKKLYRRKKDFHEGRGFVLILLLAQTISWLFWGLGWSSFAASSFAIVVTALLMLYIRKDLFIDALGSGILMAIAALPFYCLILLTRPDWVDITYPMLSGIRMQGIPIEELAFWFLAGFLFGPFYEYWQGERLRSSRRTY